MKKILDLVFQSVANIGEDFKLEDLLKVDKNERVLSNFIEEQAKLKANDLVQSQKVELNTQLEQKRNLLEKDYQNKQDTLNNQIDRKALEIERQFQEKVSDLKSQIKNGNLQKDETIKLLQEQIQEHRNYRINLDELVSEKINSLNRENKEEIRKLQEELTKKQTSANVIGELGEEQIISSLKTLYPNDDIFKPEEHSGGADIDHTFKHEGKEFGNVLYEVKNKGSWGKSDYQNFVEKVNKDQHDFNIYVHNKVPSSRASGDFFEISNNLTFDRRNKVLITNFNSVVSLAFSLRSASLSFANKIEIQESKNTLQEKVFEFVQSPEFNNYFTRIKERTASIDQIFEKIKNEAIKGKTELDKINTEVDEVRIKTFNK